MMKRNEQPVKRVSFRNPRQPVTNTSGRVFEHMHTACLQNSPSLNAAHSLWVKSMCIPTESLDGSGLCSEAVGAQTPLDVLLVLHVNDVPTVESTAYSLTIKISPTCTKTFQLTPGAKVCIPTSTTRPTLVTVLSEHNSEEVPLQHFLIDIQSQTTTAKEQTILLEQNNYTNIVYAALTEKIGWKFPCVRYERDVETMQEDYDMQKFSADLTMLDHNPIVLPHGICLPVSCTQAQQHVAHLERDRQHLLAALYDCRRSTAIAELGATEANADDTMQHVNWDRSYCVPSDIHLSQMIVLTRELHNKLATTSNMAVDNHWLDPPRDWNTHRLVVSQVVSDLLRTRKELSRRVAGRRTDLQSVVRVRTCFLLLSAIDDALRSVCGTTQLGSKSLFSADNISCHAYWLGQMKSNAYNSVCMDDNCYSEAAAILDLCKRVKNSGCVLIPECNTKLSNLGRSVWQNMHLQGLAVGDALVVASAPHFLYKQKQVVDYSRHPFLLALTHEQMTHEQRPTAEQLESTKLVAILVSTDVEHRIILPATQRIIAEKWQLACRNSTDACESLYALFHPSMRSLISSALGASTSPDISFITEAANRPAITGYDNVRLSELHSEHLEATLLKQLDSLRL